MISALIKASDDGFEARASFLHAKKIVAARRRNKKRRKAVCLTAIPQCATRQNARKVFVETPSTPPAPAPREESKPLVVVKDPPPRDHFVGKEARLSFYEAHRRLQSGHCNELSPRSKFALKMSQRPPEALFVRRVGHEEELDLSHYLLGDELACALAEMLPALKGLRRLCLRDNRLTDAGVTSVLMSGVVLCGGITEIDLSQNKIDCEATEAIAALLTSDNHVQSLFLDRTDLDDSELKVLMKALGKNTTVQTLSLVDNLAAELAGPALAIALLDNSTLTKLDLKWNKLGAKAGLAIGAALGRNRGLRWLSLAFNSLGDQGAMAIGRALDLNTTLRHLDLSRSRLSNRGAQALAQGTVGNSSLLTLDVSGNPVGWLGGRALLRALNFSTTTRKRNIVMKDCAFDIDDREDCAFDPDIPAGDYRLVLSRHRDWMVARSLIWIATTRPGACLQHVLMQQQQQQQDQRTTVRQERESNERDKIVAEVMATQGGELDVSPTKSGLVEIELRRRLGRKSSYAQIVSSEKRWKDAAVLIQQSVKRRLCSPLRRVSLVPQGNNYQATFSVVDLLLATKNNGSKTVIGRRRRPRFAVQPDAMFENASQQTLRSLRRRFLDKNGLPWEPPDRCILDIKFETRPAPPDELCMMNATGLIGLADALISHDDSSRLTLLRMAMSDSYVVAAQAQELVDRVADSQRPFNSAELVDALFNILPRVLDVQSAMELVYRNLSDDQQTSLDQKFKGAFPIFVGALSGRHALDLSLRIHRVALYRLVQLDEILREQQRQAFAEAGECNQWKPGPSYYAGDLRSIRQGGTSQWGDYRGFRNATMNGAHVAPEQLVRMANTFGSCGGGRRQVSKRHLQFDYVYPLKFPSDVSVTNEKEIEQLLRNCGVDEPSLKEKKQNDDQSKEDLLSFVGGNGSSEEEKSGVFCVSDEKSIWDLAHWLEERSVPSWSEPVLREVFADMAKQGSALVCEGGKVTRMSREVRVRVCHPLELSVLAWHRSQSTTKQRVRNMAHAAAAHSSLFRAHALLKSSEMKQRPPSRVDVFVNAKVSVDSRGRPQANSAFCAIQAVIDSGRTENFFRVTPSDVRVSVRTTTRDRHSWSSPREVDGVETSVVTTYYDAYVRGLPDDFPVGTGASAEEKIGVSWVPLRQALDAPTSSSYSSKRSIGHRIRLMSTNAHLTSEHSKQIVEKVGKDDELVVHLFSRTVDHENFYWTVIDPLYATAEEKNRVVHRIGLLNVIDFRNPEIDHYDLDLRYPDHWKVANIFTELAAVEAGLNFRRPQFKRTSDHDFIAGWDVPASWDVKRYNNGQRGGQGIPPPDGRRGIPQVGILRFGYECDEDDLELRREIAETYSLAGVPKPDIDPLTQSIQTSNLSH